jgi:hypothetical protein
MLLSAIENGDPEQVAMPANPVKVGNGNTVTASTNGMPGHEKVLVAVMV